MYTLHTYDTFFLTLYRYNINNKNKYLIYNTYKSYKKPVIGMQGIHETLGNITRKRMKWAVAVPPPHRLSPCGWNKSLRE